MEHDYDTSKNKVVNPGIHCPTRPSGLLESHAQKQRHNCEAVSNQSHEKKQLQL